VDTIFNELNKQQDNFLLHTFVKQKQATSFQLLKETCDDTVNPLFYKLIIQKMQQLQHRKKYVQAAHWHHSQATLFTTRAWINKDTNFSMEVMI